MGCVVCKTFRIIITLSIYANKYKSIINLTINYKWTALSNTTIGTLMASLDTNIIIIALPTIASDIHISLLTLLWIVLGYSLVTASILLNLGRLSDMFGRVKLYNIGFIIFTTGSALCSLSQTGEQLLLFRIVQALGAAFLFSNSAAIITDAFPENERGKALGINQISIVVGSVMGLLVGGFLTSSLGWRSIFWMNIPIGVFAIIWSHTKLRELGTIKKEKIDWIGNATLSIGLILILAGLTFGPFQILNNIPFGMYSLIIAGLSLIGLFVFVERTVIKPMIDLSLFKIRSFLGGNISIFFNSIARGAFILIMTFYLQGPTMKLSPLAAGIYLLPVSIALSIFGPFSGWIYDRSGSKAIPSIGLFISAIGFLMLISLGIKSTFIETLLPLAMIGAGMGIFASPNRASIMNSVPRYQRGIAAGTSTMFVLVGNTLSIGLAFLIISNTMPLNYIESIFLGTISTATNDNIKSGRNNNNNNSDIKNQNRIKSHNNNHTQIEIASLHYTAIIDNFLKSLHNIFILSAILMLISIIPSYIRDRVDRNNKKNN
jgi:EmrB/QacA subfamily drug resistance transporter